VVSWQGYYINLDRAQERRARMEAQLRALDIGESYRRFSAIDGTTLVHRGARLRPGEVAIFRSHLDLLHQIAGSGRLGHVMEDDILLCDLTAPAIEHAIKGTGGSFDILLTDTFVQVSTSSIRRYYGTLQRVLRNGPIVSVKQLSLLDMATQYLGSMASYVITAQAAGRFAAVLDVEWKRGPNLPIDLLLQREIRSKTLRACCIFPFVTTADLEASWESQSGRDQLDLAVLQRLVRYAFFARSDIRGYAMPMLDRVLAKLPRAIDNETVDLFARI
jgi:GR25 family glycosyltransferase involved in LPS biosynthesis